MTDEALQRPTLHDMSDVLTLDTWSEQYYVEKKSMDITHRSSSTQTLEAKVIDEVVKVFLDFLMQMVEESQIATPIPAAVASVDGRRQQSERLRVQKVDKQYKSNALAAASTLSPAP